MRVTGIYSLLKCKKRHIFLILGTLINTARTRFTACTENHPHLSVLQECQGWFIVLLALIFNEHHVSGRHDLIAGALEFGLHCSLFMSIMVRRSSYLISNNGEDKLASKAKLQMMLMTCENLNKIHVLHIFIFNNKSPNLL